MYVLSKQKKTEEKYNDKARLKNDFNLCSLVGGKDLKY